MEKVKVVFDRYSKQLVRFSLKLDNTVCVQDVMVKVPRIATLKQLHVLPFGYVSVERFSNNFFPDLQNLTKLTWEFENFLELLKPRTTMQHVKSFTLCGELREPTARELEALEAIGDFDFPKLQKLEFHLFLGNTLHHFTFLFNLFTSTYY